MINHGVDPALILEDVAFFVKLQRFAAVDFRIICQEGASVIKRIANFFFKSTECSVCQEDLILPTQLLQLREGPGPEMAPGFFDLSAQLFGLHAACAVCVMKWLVFDPGSLRPVSPKMRFAAVPLQDLGRGGLDARLELAFPDRGDADGAI